MTKCASNLLAVFAFGCAMPAFAQNFTSLCDGISVGERVTVVFHDGSEVQGVAKDCSSTSITLAGTETSGDVTFDDSSEPAVSMIASAETPVPTSTPPLVFESYDPYKDHTVGLVKPTWADGDGCEIKLGFIAVSPGHSLSKAAVSVVVQSTSDTWKYLRSNDINFLADGKRIALGPTLHQGDINVDSADVSETLFAAIPTVAALASIGRAKDSSFEVGATVCQVTDDQRAAVLELVDEIRTTHATQRPLRKTQRGK